MFVCPCVKSENGAAAWRRRAEEFLKLAVIERSTEVVCRKSYPVGHVDGAKSAAEV